MIRIRYHTVKQIKQRNRAIQIVVDEPRISGRPCGIVFLVFEPVNIPTSLVLHWRIIVAHCTTQTKIGHFEIGQRAHEWDDGELVENEIVPFRCHSLQLGHWYRLPGAH
jgi:hypothetical protein